MPRMSATHLHQNPFGTRVKLLWHLDRLAEWQLHGDTFPIQMEINLTNYCNEACRWCISAYSHLSNPAMTAQEKEQRSTKLKESSMISGHPERQRGLDLRHLQVFLERARGKGLRAVTWSGGGEPTTHPDFMGAVRSAAANDLEQGLMTNGLFKSSYVPELGDTLRWLRVSLDTLSAARYEEQKITKGFGQVIANIRQLVNYRVQVGVNMNLAAWNVDEILQMAQWCRDEGVDYFQVRPILGLPFAMTHNAPYRTQPEIDWAKVKPLLLEAETYSTDNFRVAISWDKFEDVCSDDGKFGRTYKKCLYHYFFCVLNANGDLCVCMYHLGDDAFTFGNIYENTLDEIWAGPKRREVINMCATNLDLSTCQVCCKGHEINKTMHLIENPDLGSGINFL